MVRRGAVVVIALSCVFGMAFLLVAQEPTLANCCTSGCYAWSRRPDLKNVCKRDPKYWDDDARHQGPRVGRAPEVGAVVVFEAGVQGADWGRNCTEAGGTDQCFGHVAYVEKVHSPVEFQVSEKGWSEDGSCDVRSRIAYTGQGVSFIYQTLPVSDTPVDTGIDAPEVSHENGAPAIQGDLQGAGNQRWRFVPEGDSFKIVAGHSGKCLEVSGGSHENGAAAVQWDCYGGDNQRWRLVPVGEDFRIVARHSGKCLDVSGASPESGAEIFQWDCHGGNNQLWKRVPQGDEYTIIAKHSGRSMDVFAPPADDAQPEHPVGREQRWRLVPEGQYYRIVAEHSDKCLDVSGVLPENGAAVIQWERNGGDNQLWSFVPEGDAFRIVAKHSGRCLDVSEASPSDGAAVIQWDCNGGENQLWKLVAEGDTFKLMATHSGKCLSISGGSQSNGAAIFQWGCSEEAN
jgi:hypothetical protein